MVHPGNQRIKRAVGFRRRLWSLAANLRFLLANSSFRQALATMVRGDIDTASQEQRRKAICEKALTGSNHTAPSRIRREAL